MPPYWPNAAGDGRAVEVGRVILVEARGGMGKTRPLGEVPRLDAAAVEARALVEVERRPAGDGRAAWSTPYQNLRPRVRHCLDGLHLANCRDCRPLPPRRGRKSLGFIRF